MRLFHETNQIGHYSGNPRDIDAEYDEEEPNDKPNDVADWMKKSQNLEIQQKWKEEWKKITESPEGFKSGAQKIISTGQSHIDVAWLWRFLQTTAKCKVTFSKALEHIQKIPEYTFTGSESILYDWVRIRYPDLFTEIQKAVQDGKYEIVGGSWVEPDCHLISGEAWVRQRLYGQLFNKKYFGRYAEIEWVPDSFGFSSTLPQILRKSAAKYFFTGKLDNNENTQFPFVTFLWEGLDGTQLLTESALDGIDKWHQTKSSRYLLQPETQQITPKFGYKIANYQHSNFSNEFNPFFFMPYGSGDGGHGPTGEEVQKQLYYAEQGHLTLGTASSYFQALEPITNRFPIWKDELYLETHRGTLTTFGLVKHMNRFNENLLPNLEKLYSILMINKIIPESEYPKAILDEAWKMTLLNQFHDVLPGTCIVETYDDCWDIWEWQLKKYKILLNDISTYISKFSKDLLKQQPSFALLSHIGELSNIGNMKYVWKFFGVSSDDPIEITMNWDESWQPTAILTPEGNILPIKYFREFTSANDPFYNLPNRVKFYSKPSSGIQIYVLFENLPIHQNQVHEEVNQTSDPIQIEQNDTLITVISDLQHLTFQKSTGALVEYKFRYDQNTPSWHSIIAPGKKTFDDNAALLPEGMQLHAFKELARDFPAWNMWRESRQNPYPQKLVNLQVIRKDADLVEIQSVIIYPSPDPEKINLSLPENSAKIDQIIQDYLSHNTQHDWLNLTTVTANYRIRLHDPMMYLTYHLDFHGKKMLMKLDIPTTTHATEIQIEVPFGYDTRNTIPNNEYDQARWEHNMHRWINLQSSQQDWGFAVINKSKYGCDFHEGYLGISILHGQSYYPPKYIAWVFNERFEREDEGLGFPPSWIDQGEHVIELGLLPHKGDLHEGNVIKYATLFNQPNIEGLLNELTEGHPNSKVNEIVIEYPEIITPAQAVIIEAFKPLSNEETNLEEDGADVYVLRIVNWSEDIQESQIKIPSFFSKYTESDLLEIPISEFKQKKLQENHTIERRFLPFEIVTFLMQ